MKSKNIFLIMVLSTTFFMTFSFVLQSMIDLPFPNAAYFVYDDADFCSGKASPRSTYIFFYTFDGDEICNAPHNQQFLDFERRLDQSAPKPQPEWFLTMEWSGFDADGNRRGKPGWFIIFFDKNRFRIGSYRCDQNGNNITAFISENGAIRTKIYDFDPSNPSNTDLSFPLDLSVVQGVGAATQIQHSPALGNSSTNTDMSNSWSSWLFRSFSKKN